MNMKKKIGICATLLAALLCAVPQSVQASGKIRRIDVYDPSGNHTFPNHDNHNAPLTVGDTIFIRFRLANLEWGRTENDPTYTNPWVFTYTGALTGNETLDELNRIAANKPCLGLWVSGSLREAECVNWPMGIASDWLTVDAQDPSDQGPMDGRHYTDLIFKYTVQAGDIALPLQLANASGTGPSTGAEGYYLKRGKQDTLWKIQTTTNSADTAYTVTADFKFGDANLSLDPDFSGDNTTSWRGVQDRENRDLDLYQAGVYIQAIDFDKTYFNESDGIWRSIAQGSTTADPGTPMVEIAGGAEEPMNLYLWTTNDVAEIVVGGQVYEVVERDFRDGTHKVGTLRITTGNENVPFSIRATGTVGGTADIFLSATPTNIYNDSNLLITNFIKRTIKVGEPLPPSITVTVNGKEGGSETVTANADHRTAQVSVNVKLSEPYTGDIDVPIKVTLRSNELGLDPTNYVGLSELSLNDNTSWDTVLHVRSGQTSADLSLWMYANRGSMDTEAGLFFEVNTNDASWAASPARGFFTGKFTGATVVINRSTPVITAELTAVSADANADQEITVNVADAYGELHEPCKYTIYWSNSGNDSAAYYTKIENVAATASGDLTFTVKYSQKGDFESLYYVVNQDGKASTKHTAYVHVNAAKVVEATLLNRGKFAETNPFDEPQPVVTLSFGDEGFRMPDDSDYGYIFFVPKSDNASNLVTCAEMDRDDEHDWKWGVQVYRGDMEVGPIEMTLLDGTAKGLKMEYDIIVRSDPDFDLGTQVTSWSSKGFSFTVTNVAPNVSAVKMGAEALYESGGQMGNVSLGVTKSFYAETDDPSDIDFYAGWDDINKVCTNTTTAFQTHWDIKLGTSTLFTTNVFGPTSQPFDYTFRQAGTYTVEVSMRDKDSIDRTRYPDRFGPKFTFTVIVDAKPAVSLAPHFGTTAFNENSGGTGENALSRIDVNLSTLPTEQIAVQLTIERAGTDNGNYPLPELSTTTLMFGGESPNTTNAYFSLRNLDGTDRTQDPGFVIRAAVTNTTVNGDNVQWKDVYRSTELPITIANLAPEIVRPASNTVTRAINEPFTINYTFKDYGYYDMYTRGGRGETLYWTITGEPSVQETITPNMNTYRGTFTTQFSSAGIKTIQLQVVDKDGGESEVATWYYKVDAAKQLIVNPCGPGRSGGGNFATTWTGQRNVGVGRVWADGVIKPFTDFSHTYTYAPSIASANAFAHGYSAGAIDNGTLTPGTDYAVTRVGRYPATSNYYTADAAKDSFFYAWLLSTGGGVAGVTTTLLKLYPEYGADSNARQRVDLPEEEQDATYYPDTVLDAIFSKEYLVSDNLGDINGDQIPDIYAVNPIWDGGKRLYEVAGFSADSGGDVSFRAFSYNADGDYLPSKSFQGGMPNTADGWATLGEPFTAYREIRGEHEGLNHRREHDGLNLYVRGEWVSDPYFSEAETNAVAHWNGVQTWADFKANAPTNEAEYATAYATWSSDFQTALMKSNSWIPEKRTDPTLWDTDGDGLPDGYEYYFWYRAAVGTVTDGKWVQLTGEKFTLNNITKGDALSAEDIMKAFDPTVRASGDIATRDTDNDGLTDLEEFAMGTNPVHWDSDGDGMSDLWEVMRGLNPLKVPSNPEQNPDGDFMASYHTPGSYAIVTLNNGKVYALEQNGTNLKTFEAESFDGDGGKTKGGTNVLASVVFGVEDVSNVTAIAVFHYGNDSSACVPKKRGNPNAQEKPLDPDEVSLADTEVVSVQLRQSLMLIHDQVYNQHEFHPYTAWNINANGDVSARWGAAVNTVAYNCVDEYRVMKYRYEVGIANRDNNRPLADIFLDLTTNPNRPFTDAGYTVSWAGTDGGGAEQVAAVAEIPTYSSTNHGADTDEDGIPDGWELYVGANPNDATDASGDGDRDGLSLRNEYAGSDSCDAYQNAANAEGTATIYQYHPGNAKGWFNKFTPTDPKDSDTDRDGVSDGAEGNAFIYGDPTDDGSTCIRGGGLNPCGVDTDFDLLPDGWERQYQGTVVPAGTGFENIHPDIVQIIKRNDNLGSNAVIRAYISFGMDGTYNDAFKVPTANQVDPRTGTRRNLDFDNDGLLNFQEYLVQVLRHLRYDDTETPLMGSYLPNGIAGTRKYIGFLPMQVWDGSTFFRTARAAGFTGLSARQGDGFKYRELGYFAPPEKTWDLTMSGSRLLKPPRGLSDIATADDETRMGASRYVGTDPRDWDTDRDGMDDYYELFHGLNPLLGSKDIISEAYNTVLSNDKLFSARCTAWSNWEETELVYDAMRFPWAMGVAEADADGDGLRNTDEALLVNMPNPKNYHTDPTPLWMTDSSSKISVTAQYYCRDPYASGEGEDIPALSSYPWFTYIDGKDPGSVNKFMFTFEENEGYDTDHDWIPDEQELTHAVTSASSPLHSSDPDRRQAMYFPGEESVVQSYSGNLHRRIGENYAMLRAFSVEAWVRPEDLSREQTIVTRVCNYPSSTLSNATHQVRANFRIKMEAGGRVWGQYDSDDAVPNGSPKGFGTTSVEGITLESNKWSHVALTFDGNALTIYVNGSVAGRSYSNLIPANGLIVTLQEVNPNGSNYGVDGYDTYPSALLIGADAKELGALTVGPDSAWTNYCAHFKGWVDEVRVWDGARTETQITADFNKRYTLKDVSDLRDMVYREWLEGGTHNPNDGRPNLSPELVFHYGFQQLPSEVEADYVTSEPSGFTERVLDNVKWNGRSVDIRCGWWNAIPIASTVYGNRAIVPWVRDTCAMLPMMDGSTYDSRYWSELIGGVTFPMEVGVSQFQFPNIANPYPYWNYMAETFFREQRLDWMRGSAGGNLTNVVFDVYNRLRFGNRTLFVGGSDLLPLGGAYAKRCTDFWDGNGSTDAWTATVDDTDNDGLPDWWEAHAVAEYGADAATLTAATMVNYTLPSGAVVEMSAWEAYQIDLARGIMPGVPPTYDPAYESLADNNSDGLPDWWQKLYDVYDLDPDDDPDNDGLSNYYEWLISWGDEYGFGIANGFPLLNPRRMRTGRSQEVTDYFLSNDASAEYAGYYFGEVTSDHDFMEDWWERAYKQDYTSIGVYDPWDDKDEDGWSNFAECRNALWSGTYTADAISRYFDGEQMSLCYPSPALGVRVTYHGAQNVVGKPLVVRTHTGFQKRDDATFVVVGASEDVQENTKFIGGYYTGATTLRGFIDPGAVIPAEGHFKQAWLVTGKTYRWEIPQYYPYPIVGTYEQFMADVLRYGRDNVKLLTSELDWKDLGTTRAIDSLGKRGVIDAIDGSKQIGTIDFTTGEYSLDMAAIATLNENDLEGCVFRVDYQTRVSRDWPQSFWLSAPKEGRVREGKNTIEAFIDLNGDGNYTPGEPFGVAQNVDIGWYSTSETLIELTDTIGVVPRINIASMANDRTVVGGVSGGVVIGSSDEGDSEGASDQESGNNANGITKQVRIVRRAINGMDAPNRILMNKSFVLNDRAYIHEGDVLSSSRLDLDWQWLANDAAALPIDTIRTVEYAIEEVRKLSDGTTTNIQLATFLNHYNPSRSVPTVVRPVDGEPVHSATPTFRWSVADETMTAFELQVRDADGVVVYDSGIQRLPGRTATYVDTAHYAFNPLLSIDACASTNGSPVFADGTNWQWRVALFNAKYNTADEAAWSQWADFRTDTVNDGIATGYGSCTAAVRYYGPGTIDDPSLVVVDAFSTPDFSGQPLARARLSSVDELSSIDDVTTTNACFRGIEPGTVYLRAFFDRNNNGKWDRWEPWGYANRRDELASVSDIFSPRGITITGDRTENVPSVTIYIEDTDLNRNRIMDILEDENLFISAGNADADADGDGTGDDDEDDIGTDPSSWDSDGDGMPDGWELDFAGTDPLMFDAGTVIDGDMMAYVEETWKLVTDASGTAYLLNPASGSVRVGDDLPFSRLVARYDYPVVVDNSLKHYHGVGTNLVDGATVFRVVRVEDVTAVLVHAQVYAANGFDPLTANATAYSTDSVLNKAVNTKPFTALDKYLLIRYFEALGFCTEADVNANKTWAQYSLRPNDPDNDRDGVPDGWELYTMFGTEGVTDTIDTAKISPWQYDDARALAPAGDVTVIEKWNNGAPAYDPWSKDTNGNGIPDEDEIKSGLSDLYGDSDNDQLPNFTEYLIGTGFTNYLANVTGISATNTYSLGTLVTDYFRRVGNLYLGEMFTDNDFMEDFWEDQYDALKISRGTYDPWIDPDDDGWSNFAECRAGTDPTFGNSMGLDGRARNYPVPTIHSTVVMGPGEGVLYGSLVVQAYSKTSKTSGMPDATWKIAFEGGSPSGSDSGSGSGSNSTQNVATSYLGVNPCREFSMTLTPGSVKPGSVSFDFRDPNYTTYVGGRLVQGSLTDSEWLNAFVEDRPTDATKGVLVEKPLNGPAREVGSINYGTGQVMINFALLTNDWYIVEDSLADWTDTNATYRIVHLKSSYVRASWAASAVGGNIRTTLHLGESEMLSDPTHDLDHVREGNNTFVVFLDLDENGAWSPGEPYGVAKDVDVGWSDAEFTVELTRTTPIIARFDLPAAIGGGSGNNGSDGGGSALTDRDAVNNGRGYAPNEPAVYPGTNMPANASSLTRVRVVRNWINRSAASADVLFDRKLDLSKHPYLTEADILAEGMFDLDWGTLLPAWGAGAATLSNATYRVVIGDGEVGDYERLANNLPVLFSNQYEAQLRQTTTAPDPNLAQMVYSSRPTFRWSHANSIDKAYPAFQLRIFKYDMTTVVYDSGVQRAPARNSDGMYEWTAPVYAGMVTPSGYVFDTTNNYFWAVSMLDAKFTSFNPNEIKTAFRLSTSGNLYDGRGYGSIAVCVKYFGPLVGSLSAVPTTTKNLIRVQAFTSPDFSGTPVAETYVTDVSTIASETVIATNAVLTGVAQGGRYYVRAYIDTDANGVKSDWESWGYACYVGDPSVKSVWAPKPIDVSYNDMIPVTTVFIEDADTDGDDFPDAWEINKNGNLWSQIPIYGNTFFAAVNPTLEWWLSAYSKVAPALERSSAPNYPKVGNRLMAMAMADLLTEEGSVPPKDTTSVRIKSFSLEDGLELEVVNTASVGDASGLIVFSNEATVQLTLSCATTPDFADAVEVPIKTITIYANKKTDGDSVAVTAEELAAARANVPEARFFKVILTK